MDGWIFSSALWSLLLLLCTSAIDTLLFQCLNKWNGIVKKHLVILLLYVITAVHDNICSHSQSTDRTTPSHTLELHLESVHVFRAPCSNPHFHTPGFGFLWDLRERQMPIEWNDLFINQLEFFRVYCLTEGFFECIQH